MGVMPVLADMSPTLLESSMSPRGLLMPSPRLRLMPTTLEVTVLDTAMVDSMVDVDTGPMVPTPMPTTERGLLMPSPRLMLMPTTLDMVDSMVDTDMPVLAMVDTPMVPTPMPMVLMPTASKMSSASV